MKSFSPLFRCVVILTLVVTFFLGTSFAADIKPYKVALVIGDQWKDPQSFLVTPRGEAPKAASSRSFTGNDFSYLVVMLKSWCIPFEIIRLDQQMLDINQFIGPDGKPRVGCIIWDADQSAELAPQRYEVLKQAVSDYGISLIALFDRIKEPTIQDLLGLKYVGSWLHSDDLTHSADHFITQGLKSPLDHTDEPTTYKKRVQVEPTKAKPIVNQGPYPQVTVRELPSGAKAVWLGGDPDKMFTYQESRTLLRRAITWGIGYSLFKTWQNTGFLIMDDPGGAQCAWLEHWHYPTLTEDEIENYLIKPLKEHNAILIMNVNPAFVNDELKRVELAFQRNFTDKFGTPQNYPSTKKGLLKGMKEGVFEIQCHGWTHMQPDLFSEPGPWYGAALDAEKAEVGWYREFGDIRRSKEIPAAEASWRIKTAVNWLEHLFGVTTLSFVPGGSSQGGVSASYPNNTWRLAAEAGLGWMKGYLGPDMAVTGWTFRGTMESPLRRSAPPDGHDKGIAEHPEQFLRAFEEHPNVRWLSQNEFIGYIHARFSNGQKGGKKALTLQLDYDPHYCRHFKENPSQWNLLVSDWLAKQLGKPTIKVDGKKTIRKADLSGQLTIDIPAGLGTHNIKIK